MSANDESEPIPVYRAPMRARDRDAPRFEGARAGIAEGLVGIGDALGETPDTLDQAIADATATHGEKAGRMLLRFAELPEGEFVWTQTGENEYRLGRIDGPWRYETEGRCPGAGIHHVRPAMWLTETFPTPETPAAVVENFARGGKNLQRINDPSVEPATVEIWEKSAPR